MARRSTNKESEIKPEPINFTGPGSRLRHVRETKKISLEKAAKQLRLSPQRVSAIEMDNYADFGAGTFARGYLRSYAKFLGVSEEEISKEFDEMDFSANIKSIKPQLLYNKPLIENKKPFYWVTYLIILVLVILVIIWWHSRNDNADKSFKEELSTSQTQSNGTQPNATSMTLPGQQPAVQPLPIQTITNTPSKPVSTTEPVQQPTAPLQQLQPQVPQSQPQLNSPPKSTVKQQQSATANKKASANKNKLRD